MISYPFVHVSFVRLCRGGETEGFSTNHQLANRRFSANRRRPSLFSGEPNDDFLPTMKGDFFYSLVQIKIESGSKHNGLERSGPWIPENPA